VGLANLGFAGKGLEEIREMKALEIQLLEIKRQQAAVDEAAAAARKQAAMEELQYAQQRTQLMLANAAGGMAGTTGWQIEQQENAAKLARAQEAAPLAREKESLTKQAEALEAMAAAAEKEGRAGEAATLRSQAEEAM
jgi:hypothetical protein